MYNFYLDVGFLKMTLPPEYNHVKVSIHGVWPYDCILEIGRVVKAISVVPVGEEGTKKKLNYPGQHMVTHTVDKVKRDVVNTQKSIWKGHAPAAVKPVTGSCVPRRE